MSTASLGHLPLPPVTCLCPGHSPPGHSPLVKAPGHSPRSKPPGHIPPGHLVCPRSQPPGLRPRSPTPRNVATISQARFVRSSAGLQKKPQRSKQKPLLKVLVKEELQEYHGRRFPKRERGRLGGEMQKSLSRRCRSMRRSKYSLQHVLSWA